MQNSIKFFFFDFFPSKLFYVTRLRMSKCQLSMSDLRISCASVVNGRRHAVTFASVSSIVCVVQNRQNFFLKRLNYFKANETFSEQYKHVK